MHEHLTSLEAARALGVTQAFILKRIKDGLLPAGQRHKGKRLVWAINPSDLATVHVNRAATPVTDAPERLCECGCGEPAGIARRTSKQYIKGERLRFLRYHSATRTYRVEYVVIPETGCWEWQGPVDRGGYGSMYTNGRSSQKAHRVYYSRTRGAIPDGLDLDHMCHNADPSCVAGDACRHRRCVNPDHLEPATRTTNARRGRWPKITMAIANEIRALRASGGWTWERLAGHFDISSTLAWKIVNDEVWRE